MTSNILTQYQPNIKTIRTYDKKGEWAIEVNFTGGAKATTTATQAEVTSLESDLQDQGWQVDASLFCGGFNAKPVGVCGIWVDDYSIEPVTL